MNKRGQGEAMAIFTAFEIIVIVLVFGAFVFVSTNFDYISRANEIYAEQDLTLLASTIAASPGEITYHYPIKEIYDVKIENNNINIVRNPKDFMEYYNYYNLTLRNENEVVTISNG